MRIGMIIGEVSGDNLGASLIEALRHHYPNLKVEGILGPKIIQQGYQSLYPMERLSIMGFIEPLKRLPELIRMHYHIVEYFSKNPPDIFIGIDAPDFNLRIEKKLKAFGIKTVHYVSPTVWAWRQGRIHSIKKSIDLMLSIFPFELDFYHQHQVPIKFCGHPLADQIPLENDTLKAKQELFKCINLNKLFSDPILAILPGSRNCELDHLAETYLKTAIICHQQHPNLHCIIPVVCKNHKEKILELHKKICPELPITVLVSQTALSIAAADVVLVTSGTATLEVMLHKKPMVVSFKTNALSFFIAKQLVKVRYISQPNLLANKCLVPEFIQQDATVANLSEAILERLKPDFPKEALLEAFTNIHKQLKQNAGEKAAQAVMELLGYDQ